MGSSDKKTALLFQEKVMSEYVGDERESLAALHKTDESESYLTNLPLVQQNNMNNKLY